MAIDYFYINIRKSQNFLPPTPPSSLSLFFYLFLKDSTWARLKIFRDTLAPYLTNRFLKKINRIFYDFRRVEPFNSTEDSLLSVLPFLKNPSRPWKYLVYYQKKLPIISTSFSVFSSNKLQTYWGFAVSSHPISSASADLDRPRKRVSNKWKSNSFRSRVFVVKDYCSHRKKHQHRKLSS